MWDQPGVNQVLCLAGCLPGKGDLGMRGPGVASGALGLRGGLAAEASGEAMGEMWKGLNLECRLSEEMWKGLNLERRLSEEWGVARRRWGKWRKSELPWSVNERSYVH